MLFIVFAVIMLLAILISVFVAFAAKDFKGFAFAGFALVVLLIVTGFASATQVGARSVGIVTSFGQYRDTIGSGLHFTAPWASVEQFSTMNQPLDLKGDNHVNVNYQGGGRGTVDSTVRWAIDGNQAENLWKKYKTFDNVRDQLVLSSARDSFRVVLGTYTPNNARAGENLRPITEAVQADLKKTLADDGIKIDSISITAINLDEATQKSIEKTVTANQDIERAKADRERAKIDAETAQLRERTGALSKQANERFCLDIVNNWDAQKNGALPATFNCGLGGNNAGVLVGAK